MSNKKQTAVMAIAKAFRDWQKEWDLYNFVHGAPKPKTYEEFIEEFLQMEKQQIEEAYWEGGQDVPVNGKQCEQYYNETYGQNRD